MENAFYLLLMDEPEISLDIDWQFELINIIRELNPNCQIIISTHSPSIFGDGWGDKVVYMEDIKIFI
jgi:predicted ATPase